MADEGHRTDGSDNPTPLHGGAGTVERSGLRGDPQELSPASGAGHSGVEDLGSPTPPAGESAGLAKILPFPRDWFGPVDELVPVFPEPASGPAISASSFWDEDAGAVHQVVESLDPRWVGDGEDEGLVALESDTEDPPDQEVVVESPERVRRRRVFAIAGGVLCLVFVCAAVALAALTGGLGRAHAQASAKPAASHSTHREPAPASTSQRTVTVVVHDKTVVSRHRHHARTVATASHRADTTSHTSSVAVEPVQSARSSAAAPAAPAAHAAGSGSSAGTGCVPSPDSGCMP